MRDSIHKNETASTEARAVKDALTFDVGVVEAVNAENGYVRVQLSPSNHKLCEIQTTTRGDERLPTVNSTVVVGQRDGDRPIVLGTIGTVDTITESGERVIGHDGSDTYLHLKNDGTIAIVPQGSDTAVATIDDSGINIGDKQVVTDVSTTKDANGKVTSIDLTYTNTLSL